MSPTIDTLDTAASLDRRGVGARGSRSRTCGQTMYRVLLTSEDLRLIQACSTWICKLQPELRVRARFAHLEEQLAGARPVSPAETAVERDLQNPPAR
jgi:hypothetical protein